MLVAADHQVDRFPGVDQFLRDRSQTLIRAAVISAHVDDHDQGIRLGQHLVVVVQDRLGQVLENQPLGRAQQGDLRGFLARQAEHPQLDFVVT